MNPEPDFEKRFRFMRELIEMAVLTLLMFLMIHFAVQNFYVDGPSMEPTLHDTERILVDKWTYLFRQPARGDIIVFEYPLDPTQDFVKRIIAIPGDVITINNTTVIVDGVTLQEPYVAPKLQGNPWVGVATTHNLVIPPGQYFVLGDDRLYSDDSRHWGLVPRANIIGRAALVYWPLGADNYGLIPNMYTVFDHVHQPGQPPASSGYQSLPLLTLDEALLILMPGLFLVFARFRCGKRARRC